MAYRELHMIDVREILRRQRLGHGARRIAAAVGIDRKTAGRYVEAAQAAGITPETELTDSVVHDVARRVQAREPAPPSEEWRAIAACRAQIETWLTRERPLRLCRVHALLVRNHQLEASYDTLRRYVQKEFSWRKQGSVLSAAQA